jgi:hypothetical protein
VKPNPIAVAINMTPHTFLRPNAKKAERTQRPYRQVLRQAGALGAHNALRGAEWAWDGPIVLRVEIYWEKGRQRLDWDGAITCCKGAIDGVFDKLNADDRQVSGIYLDQYHDPTGEGYCIILVEAVETEARAA